MTGPRDQRCLFCGGDASAPDHGRTCDGRQGGTEPPLYGHMGDVPYEVGSSTSQAAAASQSSERRRRVEGLIFEALKRQPRTCDAIELATGLAHQTASAQIRALVLRGRVIDSGKRELTRRRRFAVVWRVA